MNHTTSNEDFQEKMSQGDALDEVYRWHYENSIALKRSIDDGRKLTVKLSLELNTAQDDAYYRECKARHNQTVEIPAEAFATEDGHMTEDERRRLNKMEARFSRLMATTVKQFEERINKLENDMTDLRIQIMELGEDPCA